MGGRGVGKDEEIEVGAGAPAIVAAMGGKGVGKSTFIRCLTNRLLAATEQPVVFIDLDPGQSEFTVPGTLRSMHPNPFKPNNFRPSTLQGSYPCA
jgi:polynucleotide 5'-kinase involved in rRNA processing